MRTAPAAAAVLGILLVLVGSEVKREGAGASPQGHRFVQTDRDLESAFPLVLDIVTGVADHAADEFVVEIEAAHAQREQCRIMSFDVGGEDARRRPCRPATGTAAVEHADTGAAGGQLVSDGAPDDASARDGDVHTASLVSWLDSWIVG